MVQRQSRLPMAAMLLVAAIATACMTVVIAQVDGEAPAATAEDVGVAPAEAPAEGEAPAAAPAASNAAAMPQPAAVGAGAPSNPNTNPCTTQNPPLCVCYNTFSPPACYNPAEFTCQDRTNLVPGAEPSGKCPGTSIAPGQRVGFQGDTGTFLARCNACIPGASQQEQAMVYYGSVTDPASPPDQPGWGPAMFEVVDAGEGKVGLKADDGRYLARCGACVPGASQPQQAFIYYTELTGPAVWSVQDGGGGKIQLISDIGLPLARCRGCVQGATQPDSAMVYNPADPAAATWSVVPVPV